jgi:hypothetical protein
MNLVFGSIFLFILLSPGLIFRFSYLQGTYSKLNFRISAVEELFWALIPALFLQLSGFLIIEKFVGIRVNLDLIYDLITGNHDTDISVIRSSAFLFLLYTAIIILIAVLAGVTLRALVRWFRLDLRLQFLRFRNEWHYLLSGEHDSTGKKNNIILVQIDALLNSSEGNVIYSGILDNYFLTKDNSLDRLYLTNVYRRKLKDDLDADKPNPGFLARDTDERYYAMPGYLFVIPYDKIINLNITYYMDELENESVSHESSSK